MEVKCYGYKRGSKGIRERCYNFTEKESQNTYYDAAFCGGNDNGALSLKKADSYLSGAFSDMFSVYIRSKSSQSLGMNFINSLAVNAAFMLAVFVFGLCAVGLPLICILPIIRGVGIGMLSGYLYSNFALRGLGYCVLVIFQGLYRLFLRSCLLAVQE